MAAQKALVVARGRIEKGQEVLATAGDTYTPRNKAEADRLIAAGVLVDAAPKPRNSPAPSGAGKSFPANDGAVADTGAVDGVEPDTGGDLAGGDSAAQ